MHYGKTAAKMFAVLGVTVPLLVILRPGWGSLLSTLGKSTILLCPSLALAFSIAGVLRDDRKLYAVAMLLISGTFTAFLLYKTFM